MASAARIKPLTSSHCLGAFRLYREAGLVVDVGKVGKFVRIASRNFLTACLTDVLTISAQCSLTPQASEAPIPAVAITPGPSRRFW